MNKNKILIFSSLLIGLTLLISSCSIPATGGAVDDVMEDEAMEEEAMEEDAMMDDSAAVEFTLTTGASNGTLAFFGVGGDIDGLVNPVLSAPAGAKVKVTLINGDGMPHDFFLPDLGIQSETTVAVDDQAVVEFTAPDSGEFVYFCTIPGHRAAGMEGTFVVAQ